MIGGGRVELRGEQRAARRSQLVGVKAWNQPRRAAGAKYLSGLGHAECAFFHESVAEFGESRLRRGRDDLLDAKEQVAFARRLPLFGYGVGAQKGRGEGHRRLRSDGPN